MSRTSRQSDEIFVPYVVVQGQDDNWECEKLEELKPQEAFGGINETSED